MHARVKIKGDDIVDDLNVNQKLSFYVGESVKVS